MNSLDCVRMNTYTNDPVYSSSQVLSCYVKYFDAVFIYQQL